MTNSRTQPFSRFINWFRLNIECNGIYKINSVNQNKPSSSEYFIEHDDEFYCLEDNGNCEKLDISGTLRRRIVEKAFREKLEKSDFSFKGKQGYIAYYNKTPYNKEHQHIFKAYTGFEFRILENSDGDSNEIYLSVDPHVVFVMQASVADLIGYGSNTKKLESHAVRILDEKGERTFGIDGILLETKMDRNTGKSICQVLRARPKDNEDSKEDKKQEKTYEEVFVEAELVYFEPRPEIIRLILMDLGVVDFDVIALQRDKSFLNSSTAAKDRFEKTQNIVRDFFITKQKIFPLKVGELNLEIEPDLTPLRGSGFPRDNKLPEPSILFDKADSSAVHLQPYWGLRTFGPYTKNKSEIKVSLIGPKAGINILKQLVSTMNKGTSVMPNGMRQFFNTKLIITDEETISSEGITSYVNAAEALGNRNERNNTSEITLVHLPEQTFEFELDTPYFNVKPVLLSHGLASQAITAATLQKGQWIHANLASAIFAKSRGYPWVLANNLKDFDMILGVGLSQAISKTKRAGARPRYLGYTNVFDEQGRWMFFESTSQLYDFDNPKEQLTRLVSNAIDRYRQERRGDQLRSIAIHYYQRFSKEKIESINELLKEKIGSDYRIAYIAIDTSHPFRLYDINVTDGSFPRAHYAQISDNEILLSTTGHTDLAKKRMGTPAILKISVEQHPSSFVTIPDIANQILALTRLNYQTLTPVVREPVTLLFSNLAAKFMAAFSETQWKDASQRNNSKINTVPWFL